MFDDIAVLKQSAYFYIDMHDKLASFNDISETLF